VHHVHLSQQKRPKTRLFAADLACPTHESALDSPTYVFPPPLVVSGEHPVHIGHDSSGSGPNGLGAG
jgi:hypothetical protein